MTHNSQALQLNVNRQKSFCLTFCVCVSMASPRANVYSNTSTCNCNSDAYRLYTTTRPYVFSKTNIVTSRCNHFGYINFKSRSFLTCGTQPNPTQPNIARQKIEKSHFFHFLPFQESNGHQQINSKADLLHVCTNPSDQNYILSLFHFPLKKERIFDFRQLSHFIYTYTHFYVYKIRWSGNIYYNTSPLGGGKDGRKRKKLLNIQKTHILWNLVI